MPLDLENFTFLRRKEIAAFVGDDDRTISGIEDLQRLVTENLPELIEDAELSLETLDARVDVVEDALTDGAILIKDEGGAGADTHTIDFVGPGVTAAVVAGVATVTVTGASPEWVLHDIWDFAVDGAVSEVIFTGIDAYSEILILARQVTKSVSGVLRSHLSTDGGSTFYTTSGDYITHTTLGVEGAGSAAGDLHGTAATVARGGGLTLHQTTGLPTILADSDVGTFVRRVFVASASVPNAIRVTPSAGGNLTGGKIRCFVR